ncbi:predicted protein [Plenodomus lingam JN3]|uniref:Predicted protein n=1 Tax=Leptosphaeria maculans (strain JN3 / isolate v23.1.3 / race Av1-4-5-6-7-8) TaxID=985895 RepID=E4ZQU8_LEPMJ|nr:predicted protein [Plenodomus lingam JN3]CBX94103.1 predicted protein [Plenodomus lingam JN3]
MSDITPRRVVLQCREQYFREQRTMVEAFFQSQDLLNLQDYGIHICGEPSSRALYLVLNLYCKEVPSVNLDCLNL